MRIICIFLASLFPALSVAQEASRPRSVSVQSSALSEIGPWGAAALPEGLAPLSSDLWRGADPETLAVVFSKISPDQRFPSLQNLTRQAIFSGGTAPTADIATTRARFEAANRFGPADAAARLIFGVPRLASDVGLATIAIDAGLRVGRIDEACNLSEAVGAQPAGSLWLESRAVCYALNDEAAAANLSVDLAKSRGLTDTWLSRAIAAVGGPVSAPPPFRADSGRALAISLRAKLKPPVTLLSIQDPVALSALIGTPDFIATLTPEESQELIRVGVGRGVVPLALLANKTPVTVVSDVTQSTETPTISDVETVAISVPTRIAQKFLSAPTLMLRSVEARLSLADLKNIMATQPGLMTVLEVPVLTEVALWSGESNLATAIANLAPNSLEPRLALVLALYDRSRQDQIIERMMNSAPANPVAQRSVLRDALIAWSAGVPASGIGPSLLLQPGLTSSPAGAPAGNFGMRVALDLAANRGSKGEVILLSALALQGVDPVKSDYETLLGVIKALRRVGLADAARDVARDYILANYVTLGTPIPARPRPIIAAVKPPVSRPVARPATGPVSGPVTGLSGGPSTRLSAGPSARPAIRPATRAVTKAPSNAPARVAPQPRPRATPSVQPRPKTQLTKPTWGTP